MSKKTQKNSFIVTTIFTLAKFSVKPPITTTDYVLPLAILGDATRIEMIQGDQGKFVE